ncbi:hypothetical protein [Phormidesmis priestleyi]|uniref:hypothetical protein n=1 Tax=Phormidesmis priestleyi TaxID=268141 RepID=UPI00083A606A|nr:hypothetical protein [Phormidesmis priestleyi]
MDTLILILKVLLLSVALSFLIKYAAPWVTIAPTTPIVITAILLPSVTILLVLIGRIVQASNSNNV